MKLKFLVFCFIASLMSLSSCKSKEEKAADLIKSELSKTLYDFASYEPIETTVTEAYHTAYNDSACFRMSLAIAYGLNKVSEYTDEAKEAMEHAEIWGAPDYYSSSYSDSQYYKYKREAEEKQAKAYTALIIVKKMGLELQDSINKLNQDNIIGWDVRHRFRCKTRGGNSTIGDYRYIISSDFKTVILYEDTDDQDYKNARDVIEIAINKGFDDLFND